MKCSRRDFLKYIAASLAIAGMPPLSYSTKASDINPLDWINLLDLSCISCSVNPVGCIKVDLDGVHIAPKISYWIPEAFIESARALEIGRTLPLGFIHHLIRPLVNQLNVFIPRGTYSIHTIGVDSQTYMKLYPHYFGYPKVIEPQVKTLIDTMASLHPLCLACNALDSLKSVVIPESKVMNELQNRLQPLAQKLKKGKQLMQKLNVLNTLFANINGVIPFFPSELFFFIWAIPEFSIDNKTVAPLFRGVLEALQSQGLPIAAVACPYMTEYIGKHFELPFGIDIGFLCVGHWGYGYPRTGVVRHDDPRIASLLSIARFHHLFTKTIPIIHPEYDPYRIKYQLYYPEKSTCFKIGYYADDPTVRLQFKAGETLSSLKDIDLSSLKDTQLSQVLEEIKNTAKNAVRNILYKPRATGVVVWKHYSKCCW